MRQNRLNQKRSSRVTLSSYPPQASCKYTHWKAQSVRKTNSRSMERQMRQQGCQLPCCQLDAFFHARRLMTPLSKTFDCSTALRRSHLARTGLPITNSIGSRPLPEKHILTIENISFDALKAISGSYSNVNARTHHLISAGGEPPVAPLHSTFQSPRSLHVNNSAYMTAGALSYTRCWVCCKLALAYTNPWGF